MLSVYTHTCNPTVGILALISSAQSQRLLLPIVTQGVRRSNELARLYRSTCLQRQQVQHDIKTVIPRQDFGSTLNVRTGGKTDSTMEVVVTKLDHLLNWARKVNFDSKCCGLCMHASLHIPIHTKYINLTSRGSTVGL